MPVRYTLRLQFGFDWPPEVLAEKLVKLARSATADEIAVFYFAEELNHGHETLDEIRQWIEHSRPYREALRKAGVSLALNPWHTLLHADRHRTLKPGQDWQTMVGPRGDVAKACVCPLDPNWRAYYKETMRLYAEAGFRVIWADDDIRFHNHPPLHWGGCFCPLHVNEFNRRYQLSATREQIVANCLAPGKPHPWREMWLDMWEDTQLAMIREWREVVEPHGARLGLMSSAMEHHAAEGRRWRNWWAALSGDVQVKPPIHRPHFWYYGDVPGHFLADSLFRLDQNRNTHLAGTESGPEIECFPYGQHWKSYRQLHAQMAAAMVMGSNNLNISVYDFMGNDPADEPERERYLREWRPAGDFLAETFPMSLRTTGVGLPWSEEQGRRIHTSEASDNWFSLVHYAGGWATRLAGSGVAFSSRESERVNAIAGACAWAFTDDDLKRMLSRGLLLDGHAASVLIERGFGPQIGLDSGRFVTKADVLYSVEWCIDAGFALHEGAKLGVNLAEAAPRMLQGRLRPGARAVSELRDPKLRPVGHGLVVFENDLGGRVAVVPWDTSAFLYMSVQRAAQVAKTIDWLARGQSTGSVTGGPWLVPQFLTDMQTWRGAVWNVGQDEVSGFTLRLPHDMARPARAVHIDARGRMADARIEGDRVTTSRPLHQWELVVLT